MEQTSPRSRAQPRWVATWGYQERIMQLSAIIEIERPPCPKCGKRMLLTRIVPGEPGYDTRTFECEECIRSETFVVHFR
jgi:tRNA(Ile2) C34 agmatinyltransferase TiaS